MMRRPLVALLLVLAAASGAAEPLSRAQAVARALERNPTVLRSLADRDGLRGRAKQARADALPEVSVYGSVPPLPGPGLLQQPQHRRVPAGDPAGLPADRLEPVGRLRERAPDAVELQPRQGDPRGRLRGRTSARRTSAPRARTSRCARSSPTTPTCSPSSRSRCAEKVVQPEGEAARDGEEPPRRPGVATDLEVLRFEVDLANVRTTLLRLRAAADLARGDLNAVMVEPTDTPIEPTDGLEFRETGADQACSRWCARRSRTGPR